MNKPSNVLIILLILITLSIIDSLIWVLLGKYYQNKNLAYLIIGTSMYIFVAALLVFSFNYTSKAVINALWNAMSIIYVTIIGYFYFKEKLTIYEMIAVGLSFIATLMVLFNK